MGRLGGLTQAMSNVAEKLKQDRLAQQQTTQKRGLLGFSSLLSGETEVAGPEDTGGIQVPGVGRLKPVKKISKFGSEALAFEEAKFGIKNKGKAKSALGTKEFHSDVSRAQKNITAGSDPFVAFQELSQKYPKDSTWLKRQLIEKGSVSQSIDDLIKSLNE